MSLIKSIICVILTLGSLVVYAEDLWLCDNSCSSSYSLARNMSRIYNDGDIFSVINVNDNTASTYRVDIIYRFGEMFETVRNITTTSHASSSLDEIKSAIDNFEKGTYRIPSNLPGTTYDDELNSVHDFLKDRGSINPIGDWINDNAQFEDQIAILFRDLVAIIGSSLDIQTDVTLIVEVVFEDGSRMNLEFNFEAVNSEDAVFEFVDDSAKDKNGRLVPDELSDFDDGGFTLRFGNDEEFFTFYDYTNVVFEGEIDWTTSCSRETVTVCSTGSDGIRSCVRQILCL